MLKLTRKLGEAIVIEGRATVTVIEIHRGHVKLGIECGPTTIVRRAEKPPQKPPDAHTEAPPREVLALPERYRPARVVPL